MPPKPTNLFQAVLYYGSYTLGWVHGFIEGFIERVKEEIKK